MQNNHYECNGYNKEDKVQWDHVNVIGKVGRAIRARLEIDHPSTQKDRRRASLRLFLISRLSNQYEMLFPEFPNSAPNENPSIDMHSRKQWSRDLDEKTRALLVYCAVCDGKRAQSGMVLQRFPPFLSVGPVRRISG